MAASVGTSRVEAVQKFFVSPPLFLYGLVVFISASLMFWVQPLAVRGLLPMLGGSPLVWNAAMVFFQLVLLLGYLTAHLLARYAPPGGQLAVLGALWCAALLTAWVGGFRLFGDTPPLVAGGVFAAVLPALWLLGTLAGVFGPVCLAVSVLTPLVSVWLWRADNTADPYFLYAASNLGSIGVLVLYPFVLEPLLGVSRQLGMWHLSFVALIPMLVLLGVAFHGWRRQATPPLLVDSHPAPRLPGCRILALALIPSGLLFGVTQRLSTDVAAVPFLWVLPLALYLGTYVYAFGRRRLFARHHDVLAARLVPSVLIIFAVSHELMDASLWSGFLHLVFFGLAALYCHGLLAELRPPAADLTRFYLLLSAGGFAGGVLVTLAAPLAFSEVYEYPILFSAVALMLPVSCDTDKAATTHWRWLCGAGSVAGVVSVLAFLYSGPLSVAAGLIALGVLLAGAPGLIVLRRWPRLLAVVLLAVSLTPAAVRALVEDDVVRRRTFFGVYRVVDKVMEVRGAGQSLRLFYHGTTLHGLDWFMPGGGVESRTAYYAEGGPYAQVFGALHRERPALRIGLAGLGAGSLLCHARPGDTVRVYEIDAAVVSLARAHFAPLRDCAADTAVFLGDARLLLGGEADASLDVIILDAFSSGQIPVHLLTLEAFRDYLRVLAPGGVLVVHVSNRYLDLEPLLGLVAGGLGLAGIARHHQVREDAADWPLSVSSHLLVLARQRADIDRLSLPDEWVPIVPRRPSWWRRAWTDDYASIVPYLR